MNDLDARRFEIDRIDTQIIKLIAERKKQVRAIIAFKKNTGMQAHQPARFEQVIAKCRLQAEDNGLDPSVIEEIWHTLHNYFLRIEKEKLER